MFLLNYRTAYVTSKVRVCDNRRARQKKEAERNDAGEKNGELRKTATKKTREKKQRERLIIQSRRGEPWASPLAT